ncbi:MAG: hypothetical protein KBT03_00080, partial [Bacteroidales bacterium]|nr:hypothetical protein [Candidatus Scybalousia scybalohippi]
GCKSDLQILQVGLADILNRICRKIKPRFTLAKRSFRKLKRGVRKIKRGFIFWKAVKVLEVYKSL